MSFPNVIYGSFGDEKVAQSSKIASLPLGQTMVLPDGRQFRHARAYSTGVLTVGTIVGAEAGTAGHGAVSASGLLASATTTYNTVGETVVHLACTRAVATVDLYADGWLNVQKSAGIGHTYRIKSNASAASTGADLAITLEPDDPIKVAFAAGSTAVSLRKSPYAGATPFSVSAVTGKPLGVVPVAVSASYYFWAQTRGPASVRISGTTVTDGKMVVACSVTTGSATVITASSANADPWMTNRIGYALETVSAADAALVDLDID